MLRRNGFPLCHFRWYFKKLAHNQGPYLNIDCRSNHRFHKKIRIAGIGLFHLKQVHNSFYYFHSCFVGKRVPAAGKFAGWGLMDGMDFYHGCCYGSNSGFSLAID